VFSAGEKRTLKIRNITTTAVLFLLSAFMDIRIYSDRNGRLGNSNETIQCHHPGSF